MKIRTLNDYVAVKDTDIVRKTASGIYVAPSDSGMPETHIATVVSVPEERKGEFKEGDKVLYKHFRNIKVEGVELIKGDDIFGVV